MPASRIFLAPRATGQRLAIVAVGMTKVAVRDLVGFQGRPAFAAWSATCASGRGTARMAAGEDQPVGDRRGFRSSRGSVSALQPPRSIRRLLSGLTFWSKSLAGAGIWSIACGGAVWMIQARGSSGTPGNRAIDRGPPQMLPARPLRRGQSLPESRMRLATIRPQSERCTCVDCRVGAREHTLWQRIHGRGVDRACRRSI